MHKKTFPKIAALVVLLAFIFLSAPGLSSAEKKSTKIDWSLLVKKPAAWISAAWNMFSPIFGRDTTAPPKTPAPSKSYLKVKPLGDAIIGRPSGGD